MDHDNENKISYWDKQPFVGDSRRTIQVENQENDLVFLSWINDCDNDKMNGKNRK